MCKENGVFNFVSEKRVLPSEEFNRQCPLSYVPKRDRVLKRPKIVRTSAFVREILLLMRVTNTETLSVSLLLDSFPSKTLKTIGVTMKLYVNLFIYNRKDRTITKIGV